MKHLKINDSEIVYLPKNLNLEEQVRKRPPAILRYHNNPQKALERIAVVLGQINARLIHNKDFEQSIEDGFVPLNASVLQRLVEDYKGILFWAEEVGIVEIDRHYVPDQKAMGYRYADWCWKETRKHYISDPILIRNLRGRRVDKKSVEKQPFLYKCLQEIEIDQQAAIEEIHRLFHEELETAEQATAETKMHSRIAAIDMLANRQFFFRRDQRVGRLHTNVTGLKREARKFLSWQGQELVNVDIKNSQPFFSLALFREEAFQNLNISKLLSHFNPTLPPLPTFSPMLGKYQDISVTYGYEEVVVSGKLYDRLGEMLNMERAQAKNLIFNIFFSVPSWNFPGKDEFIKLFPEGWEVFEWVNTGFYKTKKQGRRKKDQSNALAMLLQKIESTVILDHVVPRIEKELKGLPIWTIHDSVMTIKGEEKIIAGIMMDECNKVMGVSPRLDFEHSGEI